MINYFNCIDCKDDEIKLVEYCGGEPRCQKHHTRHKEAVCEECIHMPECSAFANRGQEFYGNEESIIKEIKTQYRREGLNDSQTPLDMFKILWPNSTVKEIPNNLNYNFILERLTKETLERNIQNLDRYMDFQTLKTKVNNYCSKWDISIKELYFY